MILLFLEITAYFTTGDLFSLRNETNCTQYTKHNVPEYNLVSVMIFSLFFFLE
jgi:hypothetical protein